MIRAVIVEDEGVAARRLASMLKKEGIEIIESFKSNRELKQFLRKKIEPDLYFLDIHLNDGVVFESLQEHKLKSPIIFTTAYDEFAIKAFKQNSIDYLLKPFEQDDLQRAIEKYKSIYQQNKMVDLNTLSKYFVKESVPSRTRIKVKVGNRFKSLKMTEVPIIFSQQKSTFVTTPKGRTYPVEQSIEQISSELDPQQFLRVNRGQIVNIDFVHDVIAYSNSRLKVSIEGFEDMEIIVARDRVSIFKEWLG